MARKGMAIKHDPRGELAEHVRGKKTISKTKKISAHIP